MKHILSSFQEQIDNNPHDIKLIHQKDKWTNNNLNKTSNYLANFLERKIKPGSVVGLYLPKNPILVVAILAILKLECVYLPLDSNYPIDRLKYMVKDSNCDLILSTKKLPNLIDNTVNLDFINKKTILDCKYSVTGDSPAYLIYTSGSTGNPKGALIGHRALCNELQWFNETFKFNETDRILQKTPISFDASTWELFLPLTNKMIMILSNTDDYQDPFKLTELLIYEKITVLQIVPSLALPLIKIIDQRSTNLRLVFCGGEKLNFSIVNQLQTIVPQIVNLYGPTECCCNSVYFSCSSTLKNNCGCVPIGKPINGVETYVLNSTGELIPSNNLESIGELYLGGICLGLGYVNNPDETLASFNYFLPNKKLYKTGDFVKWTDNENLLFVNRKDSQIKLNGHRIDLSEIENLVINEISLVKNIKTLIQNNQIILFVESNIDSKIIKRICTYNLPNFMIPSKIIVLKSFPYLPNGKIDVKHLSSQSSEQNVIVKPSHHYHYLISDILKLFIGEQEIDITTTFQNYGLDSINLMLLKETLIKTNEFSDIHSLNLFVYNTIEKLTEELLKPSENLINSKMKISHLINSLNGFIQQQDKIVVIHSSLPNLNLNLTELKTHLIQELIRWADEKKVTIFIPTFTFGFIRNQYYDYKYSPSETGILGEWLLEIPGSIRTNHPIYSFASYGPLSKKINDVQLDTSAFGYGSIFDIFDQYNARIIMICCQHITQIHYYEHYLQVPYRYYKNFSGICNYSPLKKNQSVTCQMYVRNLDLNPYLGFKYMDYLDKCLRKINWGDNYLYSVLCQDIKQSFSEAYLHSSDFLVIEYRH